MTIVAFGITGDLMRLKILPSLLALHDQGLLPEGTRILGISRRPWDDAKLRTYLHEMLPHAQESFLSLFKFMRGDAENLETFSALSKELDTSDALICLSIAPLLYQTVFAHMADAGFATRAGATRIMIEKPFGLDGASAEKLYAQLLAMVAEENIYLVDHYLAKEWVQGLSSPTLSRENIKRVEVRILEEVGVEKRGVLYDQIGTLRDVVQNHLLQILAHVLAPNPRAQSLEELPAFTPAQVTVSTVRGQYEGYRAIPGVAPQSQTETYCKIRTILTAPPAWQGVEVVLEAGKHMDHAHKEVVLTYKDGKKVTISERPNVVGEYETILRAAIQGDHQVFASIREVRAEWHFIDPIEAAWATGTPELISYTHGIAPHALPLD